MNRIFKMSVGIGGPSIIMIFVILCLTTLGCLSLVAAKADWKLTKKSADALTAYYKADSQAEEIIAAVDADIKAGQRPEATTFTIPVSDKQSLILELAQKGSSYKILSQKLITVKQWNYDDYQTEFSDILVER